MKEKREAFTIPDNPLQFDEEKTAEALRREMEAIDSQTHPSGSFCICSYFDGLPSTLQLALDGELIRGCDRNDIDRLTCKVTSWLKKEVFEAYNVKHKK